MNTINENKDWKKFALEILVVFRSLFTITLIWDFFLTVGFPSSQRALVLTGIGAAFAPYIIFFWILCIIGITFTLIYTTYGTPDCENKITKIAYMFLTGTFFLYGLLIVLAILNPVMAWPVILSYVANIGWIMGLIYFRREVTRLS